VWILGTYLVRNFKGLPNCSLKAMCDLSEARLKHMRSLYSECGGGTDFEHLLNVWDWMQLLWPRRSGITITGQGQPACW